MKYIIGMLTTILVGCLGSLAFVQFQFNERLTRTEEAVKIIQAAQCDFYVKQKSVDSIEYILGPYRSIEIAKEFINVDGQSGDVINTEILEDCGCEK